MIVRKTCEISCVDVVENVQKEHPRGKDGERIKNLYKYFKL